MLCSRNAVEHGWLEDDCRPDQLGPIHIECTLNKGGKPAYNAMADTWQGKPTCVIFGATSCFDPVTHTDLPSPATYCSDCGKVVKKLDLYGADLRNLKRSVRSGNDRMSRWRWLGRGAAIVLAACNCAHPGETAGEKASRPPSSSTTRSAAMDIKIHRDCDFSKVEKPGSETPCSPQLGEQEENVIRINAPEEVTFTSAGGKEPLGEFDAHFMICGAMQMLSTTLFDMGIRDLAADHLVFVAVDARSQKVYSGGMPRLGVPIPMPEEDLPTEPMKGYMFGEYFNPNLAAAMAFPPVETEYYVHAVLGPFKSNVLKVSLRRK